MRATMKLQGPAKIGDRMLKSYTKAINAAAYVIAEDTKIEGRKNIAGSYSHMGKRMQQALRVQKYPISNTGANTKPSASMWHKVSYSKNFEAPNETIIGPSGRRFLWIPFSAKVSGMGRTKTGGRLTPLGARLKFGQKLIPVFRAGHRPLLGIILRQTPKGKFSSKFTRKDKGKFIPLFFGVSRVKIAGQWHLEDIGRKNWSRLGVETAKRL